MKKKKERHESQMGRGGGSHSSGHVSSGRSMSGGRAGRSMSGGKGNPGGTSRGGGTGRQYGASYRAGTTSIGNSASRQVHAQPPNPALNRVQKHGQKVHVSRHFFINYSQSNMELIKTAFIFCISIIAILMIDMLIANSSSNDQYTGPEINREKLADSQCILSDEWIDDEVSWLSNRSNVQSAMQTFYDETGVQPYLIIADNLDGKGKTITDEEANEYLEDVYDALYDDEGHMILLFLEYEPNEYLRYVYAGTAAGGVIDSYAKDYIVSLVDKYYTTDLSDDEYFAKIFKTSGKNLMQDYNADTNTRNVIIIICVLGICVICIYIFAKHAYDAKTRAATKTKEILDTPIGQDPDNEKLINKYTTDKGDRK